jgi:hypothetical protein
MVDQLADFLRQQIGAEIGFLEKKRRAGPHKNLRVPRLVIFGRVGKWNQNRGKREGRELSQAGGAGAGNGEIGGAINFFHRVVKRRDVGRDFFAEIIVRDEPFVARPGKMNHLDRDVMQGRQRFDDGLIDSAGALASAHDQKREEILPQPEPLPREFLIDRLKLLADRRAGYFRPRFRKKRRAFLEAEENGTDHPGCEPVGLPGNGV